MIGHRWWKLALPSLCLLFSCSNHPVASPPKTMAVERGPEPKVTGWLDWRGPDQNGTSLETGLVDSVTVDGENHLWSYPLSGRGTPVIANGRLYTLGYSGSGAELREQITCLDAASGELKWEHLFSDFLNDSIYSRYAIGSTTIDAETENIFFQTSPGVLHCYTKDGEPVWEHSMMELNGRLTFPNGRVGAPVIDDDLIIVHGIITNWGRDEGPARDRFYAFDKFTGEQVWACTPGVPPKDSSFSRPYLEWRDGRRLLYAGTGCGNLVCIDVRTGDPLWRFQMSLGGVNSSPVVWKNRIVCLHGKENLDTSEAGRMVAIKAGTVPPADQTGPTVLGAEDELWRNHLHIFTSSPVLAGDRIYQTVHTGELCAVDVASGKILWEEKFATEQIHASPVWADGKLYVPMNDGGFHIVRPTDEAPVRLCSVKLAGACLGSPAICAGRIYVHTTEMLYCFGRDEERAVPYQLASARPEAGEAVRLQIVPSDVHMTQGETVSFRVRSLDAKGQVVDADIEQVWWQTPDSLDLEPTTDGIGLSAAADGALGTGILKVSAGDLTGTVRVRVQPTMPFREDFESYSLTVPHYAEEGVMMQFPPSYWFSSKPKWEIREFDGTQVLAKRLDNMLFQRSTMMIGQPDMSEYTVQVDIRSDGSRRMRSSAGIVNQRYLIVLKGNANEIEITSNFERIKHNVEFKWKKDVWYTLKTRCDSQEDGSTIVRGKCWPRDEAEPEAWTVEYHHKYGHHHGAVGLFGYAPQARYRVYLDNLQVTPNEAAGQ